VGRDDANADWKILSAHTSENEAQAALDECERLNSNRTESALHVFQSGKMSELYGFTVDATGANLPIENGPWEVAGDAIPLGTTMASTSPRIAEQIERHGYALVKGHTIGKPLMSKKDSRP
jgi:hypothetical protein